MTERLNWIKQVQDQIDVQQAAERLEAFVGLVGGFVFEVVLQLTAQAIVAAL